MAELSQLRKLGQLLDAGKTEDATEFTLQMLRLRFSNVGMLINLLSKYAPLNISPYKLEVAYYSTYDMKAIVTGYYYFPYIFIANYEVFDNYYFMGYHTYGRGHILYDFKISRGYFIVSKYVISVFGEFTFIGGVKRQFDALYNYCNVTKPNYYLTLDISEDGPNIAIRVSYKDRPITTVIYSNATGDRLNETDKFAAPCDADFPLPDYEHDPVKLYSYTFDEHERLMPGYTPLGMPEPPVHPYECKIITKFEHYEIISYYNAHYSRPKKANYCHSLIRPESES